MDASILYPIILFYSDIIFPWHNFVKIAGNMSIISVGSIYKGGRDWGQTIYTHNTDIVVTKKTTAAHNQYKSEALNTFDLETVTWSDDCKTCSVKTAMCITHVAGLESASGVSVDFTHKFSSNPTIYIFQTEQSLSGSKSW